MTHSNNGTNVADPANDYLVSRLGDVALNVGLARRLLVSVAWDVDDGDGDSDTVDMASFQSRPQDLVF